MSHAETLDRALRLLARSRRVLDFMADEIQQGRALNRNDASIAQDLAGEIVALIGHGITDQPEADEMFALRDALGQAAERDNERAEALREAAEWFLKDEEDGGPSYHIDGYAHYDGGPWIAAHLRARADALEAIA